MACPNPELDSIVSTDIDLFNDAPIGIFYSSPQGQILCANPALATLLGYGSPAELCAQVSDLGRQVYLDPSCRREIVEDSLTTDAWLHREVKVRRKNGAIMTVLLKVRRVCAADGSVRCLEGFVTDITSLKEREEELRECAERWQALDQVGVVMLCYNVETGMIHFSDSWKRMLGYASHEIANWHRIDDWHAMLHPDEHDEIVASVRADIEAGVSFSNTIHRVRRKDGSYIRVHLLGTFPHRDSAGRATLGAGVLTNISSLQEVMAAGNLALDSSASAVWCVDLTARALTIPDYDPLRLTAKENQLLTLLAEAAPQPLVRETAERRLYGRYDTYTSRNLDVLISRLRRKVETLTGAPFPLQTLYGIGFRFTALLESR